jgi:hypothetical protein
MPAPGSRAIEVHGAPVLDSIHLELRERASRRLFRRCRIRLAQMTYGLRRHDRVAQAVCLSAAYSPPPHEAFNGAQAVAAFERSRFDTIFNSGRRV